MITSFCVDAFSSRLDFDNLLHHVSYQLEGHLNEEKPFYIGVCVRPPVERWLMAADAHADHYAAMVVLAVAPVHVALELEVALISKFRERVGRPQLCVNRSSGGEGVSRQRAPWERCYVYACLGGDESRQRLASFGFGVKRKRGFCTDVLCPWPERSRSRCCAR